MSAYDSDKPIITGTAAPDNVLGRAASIHALDEFWTIVFSFIHVY